MRSFLLAICILVLSSSLLSAQTKAAPAKPAEKAADKSDPAVNLPSEATVDLFLHQSLGYQPDLTWKIASIRPAGVGGLAEVTVVIANQQGQQISRFYVTPDGARGDRRHHSIWRQAV